ncbi:hypothetical protein [Pseudoalteromonas luteoviolacea]|uniref:Uncharacterized protein n=1 Tax=Pseudoalteromonas luteoviolacea NCIMB 1942 TaxID=1365253 RepID=A0A166Z8C8_9GAMM|nr:hypothetical protein [Pseudoalteromonas luteoviolacea]KZN44045.1 hypothetical protein N482_18130 [Pseudoalteromonas luteoviolacea NCIMB 1942]
MTKRVTKKALELTKGAIQVVSAGNGSGNDPITQSRLGSEQNLNTIPASKLRKK